MPKSSTFRRGQQGLISHQTSLSGRAAVASKHSYHLLLPHLFAALLYLCTSSPGAWATQFENSLVPRASSLSVYIYDPKENSLLAELSSCTQGWRHGQWGTELAWHWYLRQSPYLTTDPTKADLFYVPIYPKCVSMYKGDAVLSQKFAEVILQLPYFQLSGGEDHIFVFPSGAGPTFFTKWREFIPNSIFFVAEAHYTDRVQEDAPYINIHKDVVIPGMIGPETRVHKLLAADKPAAQRTALATYFGRDQGKYTRKRIQDLSKEFPKDINAGFVVKDAYVAALGNSKFCFVPRGQSSWTLRTYEAILTGCIPVILSDYVRLPYERWVDYNEFTIKWPEKFTDESLVK